MNCKKLTCMYFDETMTDYCARFDPPTVEGCTFRVGLREQIETIKASLAAVTQERDELKADAVRFNIHLEQKDRAIAANAKYCEELKANHPERVYLLRAEAAEKERDTLRAEKLLILQQVTEYDTLIRDALQLPPETEWRVEFYAQEIRRLVNLTGQLTAEAETAFACGVEKGQEAAAQVCDGLAHDGCKNLFAYASNIRDLSSSYYAEGRTYEQGAEELWVCDKCGTNYRTRPKVCNHDDQGYVCRNDKEFSRWVRALPTQPKEARDETKWRCLNCGYVDGRNVTFTEHCAICGEKVD